MPKDERVGKQLNGPNPKCPLCKSYMYSEMVNFSEDAWICSNCGASYECISD